MAGGDDHNAIDGEEWRRRSLPPDQTAEEEGKTQRKRTRESNEKSPEKEAATETARGTAARKPPARNTEPGPQIQHPPHQEATAARDLSMRTAGQQPLQIDVQSKPGPSSTSCKIPTGPSHLVATGQLSGCAAEHHPVPPHITAQPAPNIADASAQPPFPINDSLLAAASGAHALFMQQLQAAAAAVTSGSAGVGTVGSGLRIAPLTVAQQQQQHVPNTSAPQRLGQVQNQLSMLYNWYTTNRNSQLDRAQTFLAELDRSIQQHQQATNEDQESIGAVSRAVSKCSGHATYNLLM